MASLRKEFDRFRGLRGIHIVHISDSEETFGFLPWDKALKFLKQLGEEQVEEQFCHHLADYDPDTQALTLTQREGVNKVVLSIYTLPPSQEAKLC
jgi:hypothetical protein